MARAAASERAGDAGEEDFSRSLDALAPKRGYTRRWPRITVGVMKRALPSIALIALVALGGGLQAASASAAAPSVVHAYANCTQLNHAYPHGVGKVGARDHVTGKSKPVTNFVRNTALYNANHKLDRDKDGVACEKR